MALFYIRCALRKYNAGGQYEWFFLYDLFTQRILGLPYNLNKIPEEYNRGENRPNKRGQ